MILRFRTTRVLRHFREPDTFVVTGDRRWRWSAIISPRGNEPSPRRSWRTRAGGISATVSLLTNYSDRTVGGIKRHMGVKAISRIEKYGTNVRSNGCVEVVLRMRLSLRKHTTFLHRPRGEFHKYHCAFAFLWEGSMRGGRRRSAGGFSRRGGDLLFVGGGRGRKSELGP